MASTPPFFTDLLLRYASSILLLLATTFVGVFLADVLFSCGLHKKIGGPLGPLLKLARLPKKLSVPMITGIIDSRAEHAMVSSLVKSGALNHREVVCYNLVSLPFGGSRMIIQYTLPVAIAGLGLFVGAVYVTLSVIGFFIGMTIGIIGGRFLLAKERKDIALDDEVQNEKIDARRSLLKAAFMAKSVGIRYVIVVMVLLLLTYLGVFDYLKNLSMPLAKALFVSTEALPITITYALNPTAAILMAGELMREGVVAWKDALIALFVGRIIFAVISEFPRHSFPFYVSMYQSKLAIKLTLALIFYIFISTPLLILVVKALPLA
jgi:hypothetical protein